jgi:hypothetical protein
MVRSGNVRWDDDLKHWIHEKPLVQLALPQSRNTADKNDSKCCCVVM